MLEGIIELRAATFVLLVLSAAPACALEYAGTCRGTSATIVSIEGIDTPRARAAAEYTRPDAISYCHYTLNSAGDGKRPKDAAVIACADKFLRENGNGGGPKAEANCMAGTISTGSRTWSNAYKLPLQPTCGDDNNQAIALFRVLCPGYEGKIEADN